MSTGIPAELGQLSNMKSLDLQDKSVKGVVEYLRSIRGRCDMVNVELHSK